MNGANRDKVEKNSIILRPLRVTDLWSVHRMRDSLSQESKRFFPSRIWGFRSISWYLVLAQGALIISCNAFTRRLLRRVYAKASFFTIVAVDTHKSNNRVIGVGYLRGTTIWREFYLGGICVHDSYQELGVGSNLMEELISYARGKGAQRIILGVQRDNVKAISLYKKYGFKPASYPTMILEELT
ncbi:MAG: GNAT family N-acetyltransferase [Methanophagales archaeon]|nr:GNAT family N-acetyltransferase [Methanophagales archaeon]